MSTEPLTPEQIEELKKRHIRSFCMRRGHISNAQEKALEELLPLYEIPYDANQMFDAVKTFENNNPLVLEIGCGMGETTAAIAQAHPEINFIGCEVFAAGVGALSKRLHDMNLKNVRIFRHDAVEVVRDMLEDNSLDGVHIFFPDPWRKARHHKRRLINESFLKLLVPKMKKDAYFHCATGHGCHRQYVPRPRTCRRRDHRTHQRPISALPDTVRHAGKLCRTDAGSLICRADIRKPPRRSRSPAGKSAY